MKLACPTQATRCPCKQDHDECRDSRHGRHVLLWCQIGVPHHGKVHADDGGRCNPTKVGHRPHMLPWNLHSICGHELLPTDHHVDPKDTNADSVEDGSPEIFEELHLASVQISHTLFGNAWIHLKENAALQ